MAGLRRRLGAGLQAAGRDPTRYGAHSLRIVAASAAGAGGKWFGLEKERHFHRSHSAATLPDALAAAADPPMTCPDFELEPWAGTFGATVATPIAAILGNACFEARLAARRHTALHSATLVVVLQAQSLPVGEVGGGETLHGDPARRQLGIARSRCAVLASHAS